MSYSYPPPSDQQPQQPGQAPQWGQQPPPPGQQYPPQPAGWGTPMPPPKKTNRAGLVAVLGCSGVLVLAVIGGVVALASAGGDDGPSSSAGKASSSPSVVASGKAPAKEKPAPAGDEADVRVTGCTVNSTTTWPAADVEIVNHSGAKSNYVVSVEFLDTDGTRLGEGLAAANNVAAGQKVQTKAQGLADTSGKITCKVSDVTRYPSG